MDRHAWDDRYRDREWLWTVDANRFVVQEVTGLAAGKALDLAAGEGRNAVWLAKQGWDVTAVDFSSVALKRAGELALREGVEIATVAADLGEYVPEPGAFDDPECPWSPESLNLPSITGVLSGAKRNSPCERCDVGFATT